MSRSILRNSSAAIPKAVDGWHQHKPSDRIFERTAYVRVRPTPSSLSERRALLVALQQHGTVEVFKRLPEIHTFICVFEHPHQLNKVLRQKQPMIVKYIAEQLQAIKPDASPSFKPVHVAAPIEVHFPEGVHAPSEENDSDPVKTFNVRAESAGPSYPHKSIIRSSLLHSRWPKVESQDRDFVYHALSEVVPNTITKEGLCDWVTGGQLSEDARLAWMNPEVADKWSLAQRFERRRNAQRAPEPTDHELVFLESLRDLATEPEHASAQGSVTSVADNRFEKKPRKATGAAKSDGKSDGESDGESLDDNEPETVSEAAQSDGESLDDNEPETVSEAARIQGQSPKAHQENALDASDEKIPRSMHSSNSSLTQFLGTLRSKPEFKIQTSFSNAKEQSESPQTTAENKKDT